MEDVRSRVDRTLASPREALYPNGGRDPACLTRVEDDAGATIS